MPSVEPASSLDAADYDPIDDLNNLFPHPAALTSLGKTAQALRAYQDEIETEVATLVARQSASDQETVTRIHDAKQDLSELFTRMASVQQRAGATEESITAMTADIKRLDNTKKNLTLSMTALKRLQMLTTAYEQLQGLISTRQYRDCAQLLQAVIQLVAHFRTYRSIDQIAVLSRNVSDVQRQLQEQVCEDFEVVFAKGEIQNRKTTLAEGCLVMDALGDTARSRLVNWYCNTQLREYRQVFRGSDEAGSLDNIARRYSWFKRMLKTYDEQHAMLFPSYWKVDEILANAFCEGTRDDFKEVLSKSVRRANGQTLDVNLLLSSLQETIEFEHGLERKFTNSSRASVDTVVSVDDRAPPFAHAISEAFEPYLGLWVEAQDKELEKMLANYRSQPPRPSDEEFSSQMVMPSSTELFNFYRQALAQCAKLAGGSQPRLVDMAKMFSKHLEQYAQKVLLYYLGERPSGATPSHLPQLEDLILVLNTADYCYSTSSQLDERIRGKLDENWKDFVELQNNADAFMGIASAAIRALVRRVEIDVEPTWREMRNLPWSKMQAVSDQSPYVPEMVRLIKMRTKKILEMIHKQQYARAFCDNLVEMISTTYAATIVQCKPISEIGAEQLLLDSYTLSKEFEELITLTAEPGTAVPASFSKRVNQTMSRIYPLLKTLQVRPSPPESLVQAYLIHVADKSESNFRRILDLKGVRKQDQSSLLELFSVHKSSPRHEDLPQQSSLLTSLLAQGTGTGAAMSSLSSATTTMQGRFEASNLGSVLMTAARDGVERFGSPALGSAASHSRNISPPPGGGGGGGAGGGAHDSTTTTGNVNQNLRNIGKFFKRDMGSFGGRFSASKGSGESGA